MSIESHISLEFTDSPAQKKIVHVCASEDLISGLCSEALKQQQQNIQIPGFPAGAAPWDYIEKNYKLGALAHVGNVLFRSSILSRLLRTLHEQRIVCLNMPELTKLEFSPEGKASYEFTCRTLSIPTKSHWKHAHFRAPSRKNYRDIDTQVTNFLAEETDAAKQCHTAIEPLDWVGCVFSLCQSNKKCIPLQTPVWLRIGPEEADREARALFVGKKPSDHFMTSTAFVQDYFDMKHDLTHTVAVDVTHCVPHKQFCIDLFKHHFKLKSSKDVHRKMIEVFSFRHDISQRRETVDAVFRLLFKSYSFSVPSDILDHEVAQLHERMHNNPDYYVYKTKPDFEQQLTLLAERQIKERALVDAIALAEHITVAEKDILGYLNLLKRPRTREFIYFTLPSTHHCEQEVPIDAELLIQTCRREKTLNHIISHLTKNASYS